MILLLSISNIIILIFAIVIVRTPFSRLYILAMLGICLLIINGALINQGNVDKLALIYLLISNIFIGMASLIISKLQKWSRGVLAVKKGNRYDLVKLYIFSTTSFVLLIIALGGFYDTLHSWVEIRDVLSGKNLLRITSSFLYLISSIYLRRLYASGVSIKKMLIPIILLLFYIIVLRTKIFFLPLFFVFVIPRTKKTLPVLTLAKTVFAFILSYLAVMTIRWLGSVTEINPVRIGAVFDSVLRAGIEREMYNQFIAVFSHYLNHDILFAGSYIRLIIEPLNKVFKLGIDVPNPISLYYTITNNYSYVPGASAHPAIYGDSIAGFGLFGVIIPGVWLVVISLVERFVYKKDGEILFVGLSVAMPLLTRGSVYYAQLYFIILFIYWLFVKSRKIVLAVRWYRV